MSEDGLCSVQVELFVGNNLNTYDLEVQLFNKDEANSHHRETSSEKLSKVWKNYLKIILMLPKNFETNLVDINSENVCFYE